jgi:hypothetical protein
MKAEAKTKTGKIDTNFIGNLYTDVELITEDPQPIYILYRDTIKSFIQEKIDILGIQAKAFGLLGIEVTIITTLLTAKFEDFGLIKANIFQGTFIAFSIILGFYIIVSIKDWWKNRKLISIDYMINELGRRGSMLDPKKKSEINKPKIFT